MHAIKVVYMSECKVDHAVLYRTSYVDSPQSQLSLAVRATAAIAR